MVACGTSELGCDIFMDKMLGYMLSWTMYGTWLQGKEKGFVKDGIVRGENPALRRSNEQNMSGPIVRLGKKEKCIVRDAIIAASKELEQFIYVVTVQSNHVHVVCGYSGRPIGNVVSYYKNAGRISLKQFGFEGKLWTRGYDVRYCYDEGSLRGRIRYVGKHEE